GLFSSVNHELVETGEHLQAALNSTQTQNVVVEMHPVQDNNSVTATTISMHANSFTVHPSEVFEYFRGFIQPHDVRFNVTNAAELIWATNVVFHGLTR
ncbi:MAG: hypothetical protein ABJX82_08650, partial [Paracoccaceae bacterium]